MTLEQYTEMLTALFLDIEQDGHQPEEAAENALREWKRNSPVWEAKAIESWRQYWIMHPQQDPTNHKYGWLKPDTVDS